MEIDKALERALRIFLCDFLVEKSNSLSIKIYEAKYADYINKLEDIRIWKNRKTK